MNLGLRLRWFRRPPRPLARGVGYIMTHYDMIRNFLDSSGINLKQTLNEIASNLDPYNAMIALCFSLFQVSIVPTQLLLNTWIPFSSLGKYEWNLYICTRGQGGLPMAFIQLSPKQVGAMHKPLPRLKAFPKWPAPKEAIPKWSGLGAVLRHFQNSKLFGAWL